MNKVAKQALLAQGKPIPRPKRALRRKIKVAAPKASPAAPIEPQATVAGPIVSATFDAMNNGQKLDHLLTLALERMHQTLAAPIPFDARNYAKLKDAEERTIKTLLLTQARVAPDKLKEPGKDKMGELLQAIRDSDLGSATDAIASPAVPAPPAVPHANGHLQTPVGSDDPLSPPEDFDSTF